MSKLKLSDLKEQGLTLTKAEAHELLSAVSQHSQHTPDSGVMYEGVEVKAEEAPAKKETKAEKAAREKQEVEALKAKQEAEAAEALSVEDELADDEIKAEDIKE